MHVLIRDSGIPRAVTWAASTSKKRNIEVFCFEIWPSRRPFPLEPSKGTNPKYAVICFSQYERVDLITLFAACDAQERPWFEFFLVTGMREQEVMHGWVLDPQFHSSPQAPRCEGCAELLQPEVFLLASLARHPAVGFAANLALL
jgi:hypothetical protein